MGIQYYNLKVIQSNIDIKKAGESLWIHPLCQNIKTTTAYEKIFLFFL
jgi:hypothetical protein